MKTKDIDLLKRFMILLVAPTGSGKSCLAASFHEAGPIYFADFDGRMNPVKLMYPNADIDYETYGPKNLPVFQVKMRKFAESCPFKTVVIDSFTSLSVSAVTYQMIVKGAANKLGPGGLFVPDWPEFNGEASLITEIIDILKILPCNVILTAHPVNRTKVDAAGTKILGASKVVDIVAYGPKISGMVPAYFNEVWTIKIDKPMESGTSAKRFVITSSDLEETAKTALPIPKKIELTNNFYRTLMTSLENNPNQKQESK